MRLAFFISRKFEKMEHSLDEDWRPAFCNCVSIYFFSGKLCIEVTPVDKVAFISEELCIGCGICTKKCPFEAITIINLPSNLEKDTTHRYSANSFKLHR
jgi:translation initiation factor RLI1